jgi:hypothetical protein
MAWSETLAKTKICDEKTQKETAISHGKTRVQRQFCKQ